MDRILDRVNEIADQYRQARSAAGDRLPLVELTGGEPLMQPNSVPLMRSLLDLGYTVLDPEHDRVVNQLTGWDDHLDPAQRQRGTQPPIGQHDR